MTILLTFIYSNYIVATIISFNIILAITVIFLERKNASSAWAWLLILFFLPLAGFILYLLLGRRLRRKHLFRWEGRKDIGIEKLVSYQIDAMKQNKLEFRNTNVETFNQLIYMNLTVDNAILTQDNHLSIYVDGTDKFEALIEDIKKAKEHIHIQYYIFKLDNLGKRIYNVLLEKARKGVKVRILFDEMGSRGVRKHHFKELIDLGGEVEVFFPSIFPLVNPRLNFRNHRKIVVIDGRIGYIGGFNVGDEYLGLNQKFGYWRDTHARIEGSAVHSLQTRFLLDWNQASQKFKVHYSDRYFPAIPLKGDTAIQIVSSGPDTHWPNIKNAYCKLIANAKKHIYIQTPYFIPDESFFDTIKIAALSGVDVRIMIPNKPDHLFVYWATYSYIGGLLHAGAKIYIYDKGFIHAKMIVVDDEAASIGTANIDNRSFSLNFEVNAFIYDSCIARTLSDIFEKDMEDSYELTLEMYQQRSVLIKFKESVSRLLAPIL